MLKLSWLFCSLACFTYVPPLETRQSRSPITRLFLSVHFLSFLHALSHRLNLFNHVLALFHAKFTCNLAIRYLYLGGNYVKVVCEKVWRKLKCVHPRRASRLDLTTSESPKVAHVWSTQGSWRDTLAIALQDKTSNLAKQLAYDSNSRLVPVARSSRQNALFGWNITFRISYTPYYKYPHTHKM